MRIRFGGSAGENAQLELERYVRERQRGASHEFAAHVAMFRNALFGQPSAVDVRSWEQIQREGVWQLPPE